MTLLSTSKVLQYQKMNGRDNYESQKMYCDLI